MKDIPLGSRVIDAVAGFTGIAICRIETLEGNVQYDVIPRAEANATKYPEGVCIDSDSLDIVDEGISERTIQPQPCVIELGQRVQDTISDFIGIAYKRNTFMNGCIFYKVAGKIRQAKILDPNDSMFLSNARLKVLPQAVAETASDHPAEPAAVRRTGTGGPSSKPERRD